MFRMEGILAGLQYRRGKVDFNSLKDLAFQRSGRVLSKF